MLTVKRGGGGCREAGFIDYVLWPTFHSSFTKVKGEIMVDIRVSSLRRTK
jgi:hypothetical protein